MLLALVRAAGRVLSRDDLSHAALGRPAEREDRSVDMLISRIRRKIESDPRAPRLIVTVPGAGYRFAGGVEIDVSPREMAAHAATQHPQVFRTKHPIAAASPAGRAWSRKSSRLWMSGSVAAVMLLGTAAVVWYSGFAARSELSPAGPVQSFVAAAVPLVTNQVRSDLADYERAPDAKALALSGDGWGEAVGKSDVESAKREALQKCRDMEPTVSCKLYAVGNTVVWAASMLELPMSAEVHADPLDVSLTQGDLIRALPSAPPRAFERYAEMPNPKALAIGNTSWAASSHKDRSESLRLASERCSYRDLAPCVLISVDGKLVVRVPQTRQIESVFTLAGARGMAEVDRLRIATIYSGRDWRALSRGKTGWYAVADLPSESAAVDAALAACAQADSECRLYAISNFRIAAEK